MPTIPFLNWDPKRVSQISLKFILILVFLAIPWLNLAAGAQSEDKTNESLVIYTYDAFPEELVESIKNHFSTDGRMTEITVVRYQDTGALFNQLLLEKGHTKADLVIGLDNTYLAKAFEENLFLSYKPHDLQLVSPGLLVDPEYRVVPFDYGSITLNYDSSRLPFPPKSWKELLDPKYEKQIILMNPGTSSPGRNFLLFTIAEFGEDGYLDFWKALKPNILTVTSGWSEGYGLYTQGEAPIVLSYDTSPAYHIYYENESRYKNLIFDQRAYAVIEVAGVLRDAANPAAAKECIDFLVGKEFQELLPLTQIMYPVHPGATLPDAFTQAGRATSIVNMDEKLVAEKFNGWLTAWENVMR